MVYLSGSMSIQYMILDTDNVAEWKNKLYRFAANLDLSMRCNAEAVNKQKFILTYPSIDAIQEFIDREDLVVIAIDGIEVVGYIICVDDREGKHGGCRCKWIGVGVIPVEQHASVYTAMGDIAVAKYGWLWGRVTNEGIANIMLNQIDGCESGSLGSEIITFKRP